METASSDSTMSQTPDAKPPRPRRLLPQPPRKLQRRQPTRRQVRHRAPLRRRERDGEARATDDLNAAAALRNRPVVSAATAKPAAEGQAAENEDGTRVYGDPDGGSRVVIRAAEDSWVEVRDGEGELLLTRVLREGDRYHVPDRAGLTLVTGNAGALKFSVDGDEVADIGPPGTVRRNVRLDPQALKDGTAHTP